MNSSTYFRDWLYRVYKPCAIVYSSEKICALIASFVLGGIVIYYIDRLEKRNS